MEQCAAASHEQSSELQLLLNTVEYLLGTPAASQDWIFELQLLCQIGN